LAAEIGIGMRQTQRYIGELERERLIRRVSRFSSESNGQSSNFFEFLWHPLLEGASDPSGEGVTDVSSPRVTDPSPKESQDEESQSEESHNRDLDYPPTNRKKRDSRLEGGSGGGCRPYSRLRETLAEYMMLDSAERIEPSDRIVVDVMNAAGGATEAEVLECLRYLRQERGLLPGTKHGPRHYSWFKTVVADYFTQKRDRDLVIGKLGGYQAGLSADEFDAMTGALE
jgi:hypothetical protein